MSVRAVPWLIALVGLAVPLVASGFAVSLLVTLWLLVLAAVWLFGRVMGPRDRTLRMGFAIGFLPLLFLLGWEGGWWLLPADFAWLLLEWLVPGDDRRPRADGRGLTVP